MRPVHEICADALSQISFAISTLSDYGVKIPTTSRLHQARDILEAGVKSGSVIPLHRGDQLGLLSLEVAHDFWAIASTMPRTKVADVRKELNVAIGGELGDPSPERRELQLQSQFVVRASFVLAGAKASHPTEATRFGKKPDLVLEHGTALLGVEVKRPHVIKNVVPRFTDATSQLKDYNVRGAVLIDVTDCVRELPADEIGNSVDLAAQSVFDSMRLANVALKFAVVIAVGVFARIPLVAVADSSSAMIERLLNHRIGVVVETRGSLQDHQAKWIRRKFSDGLLQLEHSARNEI